MQLNQNQTRRIRGSSLLAILGALAAIGVASFIAIGVVGNSVQGANQTALETTIASVNRTLRNAYDARAQGLPPNPTLHNLTTALTSGNVYSDVNGNRQHDPGEMKFLVSNDLSILTTPTVPEFVAKVLLETNQPPRLYLEER